MSASTDVTQSDVDLMQYHHEYRGGIEDSPFWIYNQDLIQKHYPTLVKAEHDLRVSREILDAVIRTLEPTTEQD